MPFSSVAVGFREGNAAVPICSPVVIAIRRNLRGKPLGLVSFGAKSYRLRPRLAFVRTRKSTLGRDGRGPFRPDLADIRRSRAAEALDRRMRIMIPGRDNVLSSCKCFFCAEGHSSKPT